MSKRIVMSILSAAAMSIGGFFVSCGAGDQPKGETVHVHLPQGCALISPRADLTPADLANPAPDATVKPGRNQFVLTCDGRMIQVDKDIAPGQRDVYFSAEELQ